jgi:predicted Zn finger-like uncharacterized protein
VKFLCDRCKTRYSIGDERVRGKILKIRCKNCANVITVREGMSLEDDGAPGDAAERARKAASAATEALEPAVPAAGASRAANEPAAPAAGASRAANEPAAPSAGASRAANEPGASRGGARDPLAALTGKRSTDADTVRGLGRGNARTAAAPSRSEGPAAQAAGRAPPAALEEEWYVSIDGEQAGPFSLAAAQRWVTQQSLDAELHCWSEGFDDWLPVDKVGHFRGLRKRPVAPSAPPPLPRAMAGAPRPAPAEDEPKPLFAATMASLERGAPAMPAGLGLPPPAASPAQATPAQATPPRGTPIAARSDLGIRPTNGAQGPATTPLGRRPGVGAESKPDARPDVRSQAQRAPAAEARKTAAGDAEREASGPAASERPLADPFEIAEGYGSDGKTVLEAMPFDDAPVEPRRAPAASGAPAGTAPAAPALAPPRSDFGSDDDLDIGEVSRVVNLGDIARGARAPDRPATWRAATAPAAATRSSSIDSTLRPSTRSTAPAASPAPGDGEPGVASAPIARAQHRGLIALLAVAIVLVLGVVGAVLFVTRSDDSPNTSLGTVQDIDTSRPDNPIVHHPVGSAGSVTTAVPAPSPPRPHPRPAPSPGSGQIAETPVGNALAGDEIEDVARKHQDMTQRCYMRSQRGADAILVGDVKKIAVTLTIDREGNVSDLHLSDHSADNLGKCLHGAIRTWKFRPSAGGTFRFSLNFIDG